MARDRGTTERRPEAAQRGEAAQAMQRLRGRSSLGRHRDHGVAVTGSVEVGVDFPQSREFKACAQFADREGTERDHMFVRLNLAAVVEDEHQMDDVPVTETTRPLPGTQHQAPAPPPGPPPACNANTLPRRLDLLP